MFLKTNIKIQVLRCLNRVQCTLYTIQSEMYVGIYAFFMLGKNLAGEYVCYYLAWLFSISIDILVHIGNKIYMLD